LANQDENLKENLQEATQIYPLTRRVASPFAPAAIQAKASLLIVAKMDGTSNSCRLKYFVVSFLPNLPDN
jgi:hypothetical protein